jgi:uncharacterized membrane protein YeiH
VLLCRRRWSGPGHHEPLGAFRLTSDFYATASLIGGILYLMLEMTDLGIFPKFLIASSTVFVIRLIAIKYRFHLPVADTALRWTIT